MLKTDNSDNERLNNRNAFYSFLVAAFYAFPEKAILPKHQKKLGLEKILKEDIEIAKRENNLYMLARTLQICALYQKKHIMDTQFDPDSIETIKREAEGSSVDIQTYFYMILRIAFPQEYNPETISDELWEEYHHRLQYFAENNFWHNYVTLALCMKVLAAEEVRITPQGLKIIMTKPKPQLSPTIPLPSLSKWKHNHLN